MEECGHLFNADDDGLYCVECGYREDYTELELLVYSILEDQSILEAILTERDLYKKALETIALLAATRSRDGLIRDARLLDEAAEIAAKALREKGE